MSEEQKEEPIPLDDTTESFSGEKVLDWKYDKVQVKPQLEIKLEKIDVNPYDIFKLAKWVLGISASIYLFFALIRIFYADPVGYDKSGIKDVWEYSKVFLNSIISVVLGMYFSAKHNSKQ